MSTLQNVTPHDEQEAHIVDQLVKLLFDGTTFSDACKQTGISRPRGYRYFNHWKQTEEAYRIDAEWWALFNYLKATNPVKAFDGLTRIKHRMTTEKVDVAQHTETNITVVFGESPIPKDTGNSES